MDAADIRPVPRDLDLLGSRPYPGLTDRDVAALGAGRAVVQDGVLGDATASAVRAALVAERASLTPAAVGRGDEKQLHAELRGDLTTWLERRAEEPLAALWRTFDAIATEFRERCWLGVVDSEVQLAVYPPDGARYVRHLDAFAGGGRRRATAVYYLNPDWRPGDGGELVAHEPDGARTIEPRLDRLVLFLADRLEHEVLPAVAPRWAVTAWLLGPLDP
ncbi:MAG: 2OG-Fe(II) oxygenase [Planctomycetota bacterium]